jgi:hypothetical protein
MPSRAFESLLEEKAMSKPTADLGKTAIMLVLLFAAWPAGDVVFSPLSGIRTALELISKPTVRMVKHCNIA